MLDCVFMLPNGMLSSGQRVAKLTKAQMKIVRALSKMDSEQVDALVSFSKVIQNQKPRPLVGHLGKKVVNRDSRLD